MIVALILLVSGQTGIVQSATAKLAVKCTSEQCVKPAKPSPYRLGEIDGTSIRGTTIDDGSKCNVVGARVCTGKPRKLFSTAIDE